MARAHLLVMREVASHRLISIAANLKVPLWQHWQGGDSILRLRGHGVAMKKRGTAATAPVVLQTMCPVPKRLTYPQHKHKVTEF